MDIYGIKNCDTMKKALRWLDGHAVAYRFHDFKKEGLAPEKLLQWVDAVGWERLLNRRGMMWRKLDPATRDNIDRESAIEVMLQTPTIIKRPVLEYDGQVEVGFSEARYQALFG
ncbi:MAG TPA: ArsC family reductase [Sedimenticola sp.]|nr:ArsC family reductase [Sedimenticola sp.]